MNLSPLDDQRIRRALALAEQAVGVSDPNPRVGCVVGRADGTVLAEGFTQVAGGMHAEAMALAEARRAGAELRGATAWVTLEPCAHHGRTPPCANALIEAGVTRVVYGAVDPFPAVAGKGLAALRAAGIEVVPAGAEVEHVVRELNIGFFSRVQRGRPWVRMKLAASLDGRMGLPDGSSRWITGAEARTDGHRWRKRASAILTGIGTVISDDPQLSVREVPTSRQPHVYVLDSELRCPPRAAVLHTPGGCTLVHADDVAANVALPPKVRVWSVPRSGKSLHLGAVIAGLAQRDVNELHVEAGPSLNAALLEAGWVDELLLYVAPVMLGPGLPLAALSPLRALADARQWQFLEVSEVNEDLRLRLRPRHDTPGAVAAASMKLTVA